MSQTKKNTKSQRKAKRPTDAETLGKLLDQYEQVFGEVGHFIELIARQESEISTAQAAVHAAKEKYETLRDELNQAREARDGTKHALFMFLKPGPAEIMPLFDRMEPADEEKHGAHSDEWRKEPVAALRLSLIATNLLAAADVLFVGQLQDRIQAKPNDWFEAVEGLTAPMAAAIADKLNDFIGERSGK
ncbi:MAG: hypothetical protein E6R03_04825 [Hyphomicrobiaceae bacterium]|nr:MAG: hypothetical protein E6R03_04825 [Hyphomicrobiaceae bacterium]